MKNYFFVALFVLLLASCDELPTGKFIQEIPKENNKEPEIYFCPKDNCAEHLINFITSANDYIYCAFYDLNLNNVIDKLTEKSKIIDVRLVIDNENNDTQINKNILKFDTDNQLSHNKFCVADDKKILTGSFNPTERDNNKNNNNVLIIYSKYLAKNYKEEFNELWNGEFGDGLKIKSPIIILNNKTIENYFCPEDNCKANIIEEIKSADKSIYFMTFSFTDQDIADALLFKENNIEIKGIFEKSQASNIYSQFSRLKDFGLDVKLDSNKANMHHKVFIIDNKTVITGSFNPTFSANERNDENILIIHDKRIAKKYLEEFNRLFSS